VLEQQSLVFYGDKEKILVYNEKLSSFPYIWGRIVE